MAERGCLLHRTPRLVPFGTCVCSTCWDQSELVFCPDYVLRSFLGTFSILHGIQTDKDLEKYMINQKCHLPSSWHSSYYLQMKRRTSGTYPFHSSLLTPAYTQSTTPHVKKEARRLIWDDITRFPKYFWQMTIARSEDNKSDDTSILNSFKNF